MRRRSPFRGILGPEPRRDVDAELAFHLEMRTRELVDRGESPERARERTLRRFGDYEASRRECVAISRRRERTMMKREYLRELRQDAGYALRMLRRAPGFTLVAIVTLALGIGATSAIYSVVHGVLLRPLPYADAERLYRLRMLYPDGTAYTALSAPDFMSVRAETRAFEQVEAYSSRLLTLLGAGEPREVRAAGVSDGYFKLLGLGLGLGREFIAAEHRPGHGRVVILDHGAWQRLFGSDPTVLGRTLSLAGEPYTVVGVLAPAVRPPDEADVLFPLQYDETFSAATARGRRSEYLAVLGRATAASSADAVDADLRRIGSGLQTAFRETNDGLTINAVTLRQLIVGDVRRPLLVLMGAVAFVLLVACANVANLLLARASARQGELTVRAALGAGRARLLRQLLTEAGVLGLGGGLAGLAIAYAATRALIAAQPSDIPRLREVGVDGAVVAFTLATGLLTAAIFGVLPAWQATGGRLARALQAGGRGTVGASGQRVRAGLVVAEMALAVVLLTGAGLLLRSFVELTRVDPGFRPEHAMAVRLTLQGERYRQPEQLRQRVAQFEERVRALPGVTAVAGTTVLPLSGLGPLWNFAVVGAPPPPPDVNQEIAIASITPDYVQAIGGAIRRGRPFTARDRADTPAVALINEAGARRWFGHQDPIGRRVEAGGGKPEIVGIVGDVLQRDPGQQAAPQLFLPYAQVSMRTVRLVIRAAGDPLALASAVRGEIRAIDPQLAVTDFTPLDQLVVRSVAGPRFYTSLLVLFAGVALLLAAIGMFGVMSFSVAQRTREISIRMALGARANHLVRLIVGRALALVAVGGILGLAAAQLLGRLLQKQLFGVTLLDPVTLAAVLLVLGLSGAVASFLPARRAVVLDPSRALREG